jgi:hypothetical protein
LLNKFQRLSEEGRLKGLSLITYSHNGFFLGRRLRGLSIITYSHNGFFFEVGRAR